MSSIADTFNHTEKDVLRALSYWEKQGLLFLGTDSAGEITEIAFLEPELSETEESEVLETLSDIPEASTEETVASETAAAFAEPPKKQPLTADRIVELKKQEDIEQLLLLPPSTSAALSPLQRFPTFSIIMILCIFQQI